MFKAYGVNKAAEVRFFDRMTLQLLSNGGRRRCENLGIRLATVPFHENLEAFRRLLITNRAADYSLEFCESEIRKECTRCSLS